MAACRARLPLHTRLRMLERVRIIAERSIRCVGGRRVVVDL
jgi:hypothetical protein